MTQNIVKCEMPAWKVIGTAKAKDIMAVHCELRRSEKEVQ